MQKVQKMMRSKNKNVRTISFENLKRMIEHPEISKITVKQFEEHQTFTLSNLKQYFGILKLLIEVCEIDDFELRQ